MRNKNRSSKPPNWWTLNRSLAKPSIQTPKKTLEPDSVSSFSPNASKAKASGRAQRLRERVSGLGRLQGLSRFAGSGGESPWAWGFVGVFVGGVRFDPPCKSVRLCHYGCRTFGQFSLAHVVQKSWLNLKVDTPKPSSHKISYVRYNLPYKQYLARSNI